jgi:benzoate transport
MTNTTSAGYDRLINGPMGPFQISIVVLCILIAGLDGFDVLVVAYTAPAISADWNLGPGEVGMLLSAGLAGMGLGSLCVAPLGDRLGRRPTVILCMIILAVGMLMSSFTQTTAQLAFMRVVTGLGIGGILANINILVSEYASDKRRALCISMMALGYPIGATLGGLFSVYLIEHHGWRSVYVFGGIAAAGLLPAVLWLIPESLDYLWARRPKDALAKSNAVLHRLQLPKLDALPPLGAATVANTPTRYTDLLKAGYAPRTVAASALYFSVMLTAYFLLSWMPKMLTESGLSGSTGISGSMLMNIAGVCGCLLFGLLATQLGPRRFAAMFMIGLFITAMVFALTPPAASALLAAALAVGFCLYTSINALYVLVPQVFPTTLRSTGTGLAMTVGRVGAVSGPYFAGLLMTAGWARPGYILVLATPMLLAAISLLWLRPSTRSVPPNSSTAITRHPVMSSPESSH